MDWLDLSLENARLAEKRPKIELLRGPNGGLRLESTLKNDAYDYIMFDIEFSIREFHSKGRLHLQIDAAGDLNSVPVTFFYDSERHRVGHRFSEKNKLYRIEYPINTSFFKIGFRVSGKGVLENVSVKVLNTGGLQEFADDNPIKLTLLKLQEGEPGQILAFAEVIGTEICKMSANERIDKSKIQVLTEVINSPEQTRAVVDSLRPDQLILKGLDLTTLLAIADVSTSSEIVLALESPNTPAWSDGSVAGRRMNEVALAERVFCRSVSLAFEVPARNSTC